MDKREPSDGFEQIAAELMPSLQRYLLRRIGDNSVAEDLLQETLIRMEHGHSAFEGRSSARTWATAIAKRVLADHFRSPERGLVMVDVEHAEQLADGKCAIEESVVVDQMNSCVRELIDGLPEKYRAALVQHDLNDRSAAQIAATANMTLSATKMRIHRARDNLKDALQDNCRFYRDDDGVFRCERK